MTKLTITRAAFDKWLMNSNLGDEVEYHLGNLAADRSMESRNTSGVRLSAKDRVALSKIADHVLKLATEDGILSLVQSRVRRGWCAYIAIRR